MELSLADSIGVAAGDRDELMVFATDASSKPQHRRPCQVPGCTANLEAIGKAYCRVKRICPIHMKADMIPVGSELMRYCQQCGVLEPLTDFDYLKRSCRDSLGRRAKRPIDAEPRTRRKRNVTHSSCAVEAMNDCMAAGSAAAAAAAAAQAATAYSGAAWDAALLARSGMQELADQQGAADCWYTWLEVQAPASAPEASAATGEDAADAGCSSQFAPLPRPASTCCTAALGAATVPEAAAATVCGMAASAVPAPHAAGHTNLPIANMPPATGVPWDAGMLGHCQLQPMCSQGLTAAGCSAGSPLGISCSSSHSLDPAMLELEQFMMQELAAAGAMALEEHTHQPAPPAPAAPAPAPATSALTPVPACLYCSNINTHIPQQQQQQPRAASPAPQLLPLEQQWHAHAAYDAAGAAYMHSESLASAQTGAGGSPAGGSSGFCHPQRSSGQLAPDHRSTSAAVADAAAAAPGPARAQMMARLQSRLQVLQSQMEDMQLMLGMLHETC